MIIREWRGRAEPSNAEAYPRHFQDHVAPELRKLPGFIGASVATRQVDGKVEFLVLTRWESLDQIAGFAGPDITKAVVEPGAVVALSDYDAAVQHYECVKEI
jgi:heme-degrading monooxygenase HmoA